MSEKTETTYSVETSSGSLIRAGMIFFVLLFVFAGGWAVFSRISGAVIAPGSIDIQGKPKTVQHLYGGIVDTIHVDNADAVQAGDILLTLDSTTLKAESIILQNRLVESLALYSRLLAERDGLEIIEWHEDPLDIFAMEPDPAVRKGQEKLFFARKNSKAGEISRISEQIDQYSNQISGLEAMIRSKKSRLVIVDNELEGVRDLRDEGLSRLSQITPLELQRETLSGDIAEHNTRIASIRSAILELEISISQVDRQFREEVLGMLREVEQSVAETVQNLYTVTDRLDRVIIRAPVDGIVHELSVFTVGGVIQPGAPIMNIVPQNEEFIIEAVIDPRFVDQIYPGQNAIVRFSAFNHDITPELHTTVRDVSPTVTVDEQTLATYYVSRILLTSEEISVLGQDVIPGMPVEVFIQTEKRSPISYLLKPLATQFKRALKEQ